MRTFLSSGSHTTILKDQFPVDKHILGKPINIFTTATTNPKHELLRRMNILNLDTSINQTKEIAKRKCKLAKDGKIEEINPELIKAIFILKRIKVKIPYADKIAEWIDKIPDENVRVLLRTQIETFLDYIKSSTAIHQYQRQKEDGFFLSEKQDYEIATECFEKMVSNPLMIPLTKEQQKVIDLIRSEGNLIELPELIEKIDFWESANSYRQINKLVGFGIIEKYKEKSDDVRPITKVRIKEFSPLKLPSYEKLVETVELG
jgi:hypothetical protein